jgi:predicted phage replisome organizer
MSKNQNSKKFYWLKLKNDFFSDAKLKKLRRIAGGNTYTVIYLKLMLLTINSDGVLLFEGIEKTLSQELSLKLDEDETNITVTLNYLQNQNLLEKITTENFLLNQVPTLIGSETDAAERMRRMRRMREKGKFGNKHNNVTPMLQDSYTEKELEEKEKWEKINQLLIDKQISKDKETERLENQAKRK